MRSALRMGFVSASRFGFQSDNVNVHRAAANIIVSKCRAARGSVCNVLLCRVTETLHETMHVQSGNLHKAEWFPLSKGFQQV